jgi:hypothetical protein
VEGEIENTHPAGSCATVNVWFAIVNVPVRGLVVALAAAVKATAPLPEPVAPDVTVSHDVSLLTAVHAHSATVVTAVEPVPPAAAIDWLVGTSVYVQDAAAWFTENVCPAIVSVPVRAVVFGFAAALNATVPLPLPLAPLVTVSHDVLLLTPVHAHPAGAVTAVDPVPPAAVTA